MKVVALILFVSAAIVKGAPAPEAQYIQFFAPEQYIDNRIPRRLARSHIGLAYASPCQAASGHIPVLAPSYSGYGHAQSLHGPIHQSYPQYGYPAYREDIGEEQEMMEFSDMNPVMSEQVPMARFAYGAAPVSASAGYGGQLPVAAGPAVGVFPNANVGGCGVPLLLSCSPSITAGHVVKSHQSYGGYGSAAPVLGSSGVGLGAGSGYAGQAHEGYRSVEDPLQTQDSHRIDLTPAPQEQNSQVRDVKPNLQ